MQLLFLILLASFQVTAFGDELRVIEASHPFKGSRLYVPNDGAVHPGILLLHGSEGGSLPYYWEEAQLLAGQGYAVLAYCWYNCSKDPITGGMDTIENIDLDKTYAAFEWLKKSSHVNGKDTALVGVSRGAEQSLILGWKAAEHGKDLPAAIAVHAPSDVIVQGFTWASMDKRCWICKKLDASCFNASTDTRVWDWNEIAWNVSCGKQPAAPTATPPVAWKWNGKDLTTGERIGIEVFKNPVFLSHGTMDEWWDHTRTLNVQKAMEKKGLTPEVHIFKGEKHVFRMKAENERRELLLKFLRKSLTP